MKPIELKFNLEQEIYYPVNILFILSDMKKERPYEYNIIEEFVKQCRDARKEIENKGQGE